MKNINYTFLSLILVLAVTLFGCNNNQSNTNQKVAEEFAWVYYMTKSAQMYSVEKTTYDKKADRYTVYIKGDEDDITKIVIVGVKKGEVYSVDLNDGEGEHSVTIVSPGGIIIN